jgi:D-glycero-alpha-D-manno-heptose-7-phosphate kinase
MLEAGELKLLGGKQDQYAAALGGFQELTCEDGLVTSRGLVMAPDAASDLARHALLVYSGQSHFSSDTHARVWDAFARDDPTVTGAIRAIRDVARQTGSAIEAGDWLALSRLVDENWRQQQRLDLTMATSMTRSIEQAVRSAGAWGLKATGAGAGGCLLALGPIERRADIVSAAERAGGAVLDLGFASDGVVVRDRDDAPRAP